MPEDIIRVEELRVTYHDGTTALQGVSLAIPLAERVGLIGPNGAGKTSLLLSLMRGVPFTGKIAIDGVASTRKTANKVRDRCGMVFQDADDQLFMPTLLDDAAFGPLNQGMDADNAETAARDAIDAVGLAGLEGRCAHHLSGGQKRGAALATILSMQVKVLLLDEPGANLDIRGRRRLIELLANRTEAMLLATHDLAMVADLCSRVIIMDAGRLVADGPTARLLGDSALLAAHGLA